MAILQILKEGEDTLRAHSRAVDEITPRILTLLDDMWDTLHESGGVGLAAPQVGVLRRVVVIECEPGELIELINPVIISTSGERNSKKTRKGHGRGPRPHGEKVPIPRRRAARPLLLPRA